MDISPERAFYSAATSALSGLGPGTSGRLSQGSAALRPGLPYARPYGPPENGACRSVLTTVPGIWT